MKTKPDLIVYCILMIAMLSSCGTGAYRQVRWNNSTPEGYTVSDGWDSPATKLKGNGSGHYMSALAFASATKQERKYLPELEDLSELLQIVEETREKNSPKDKENLDYAEMVIRYVNNGSGTMDMILKACNLLSNQY